MRFREGFQNEDFVAFYNGNKFYTGPLDSNFTKALEKLISLRALAFGDIVEYLESIGVSDVNIDDTFDVASTFSKALFYDAADGEDYWNFDGFEIFPEYELAESFDPTPLKTAKVYRPDYDSFDLFSCDKSTKNQFLGRFVADCRYFLGYGNGYEGHLWAGSVEEQIDLMRKLYDDIRPDWLSERQIDDFEDKMLQLKYSKTESIRRLGEDNSSLKLKKVKTGKYTTTDGKYEIEKSDGFWYAVDTKTGQSVVDCENSLSAIKDSLESYIKSRGKKESFRRLREGDASIKTNYAVAVRDMHTAHIHLLTGTKSECESLICSLETADDYMNDDYMDEYEKDEYIQTLYDEVLSQYNWINDINYREIDNRNNYYDHNSGKYYHILNKNWFDLYI